MNKPNFAIEAHALSKHVDGQAILVRVDLQLECGQCIALMGDNGAGKTTLLKCLAAIKKPSSGTVCWFGRPAATEVSERRLIALKPHEDCLYTHLTAYENLMFAARMIGLPNPANRSQDILWKLGLSRVSDTPVRQLSKGMRQRLGFGRAVIHDPPIWLLDEPFAGLDDSSRNQILQIIREKRRTGGAICFSTHQDLDIEELDAQVVQLHQGTTFLSQPNASSAFFNRKRAS
ncbi:MAG: heme ABC exporter ATP-binding protein CcmA [Planctomycetales bacterium]|nr:heme ABC exporter ATP-binding protein CcmA [Planctomycetales bacterium]